MGTCFPEDAEAQRVRKDRVDVATSVAHNGRDPAGRKSGRDGEARQAHVELGGDSCWINLARGRAREGRGGGYERGVVMRSRTLLP